MKIYLVDYYEFGKRFNKKAFVSEEEAKSFYTFVYAKGGIATLEDVDFYETFTDAVTIH